MAWDYRPPSKHDARVAEIMMKTLGTEDNTLHVYFKHEADARGFAEKFRYFRWCVRQDQEQAGNYFELEMQYDFRSKVMLSPLGGWHIRFRAVPNRLGYMLQLNPWIMSLAS